MGADLKWVEPQALETDLGGVDSKEGDNVSAGYAFGEFTRGGKV